MDLVIRDAKVLVGDGRVLDRATVGIDQGRIASITIGGHAPLAEDTLDAAGLTMIPGLIDTHVHLLSPLLASPGNEEELAAAVAARVPGQLREYLAHGVTTIMTNGDYWPAARELRDRVARGELPGPRILAVGPVLTAPGGDPVSLCRGGAWCIDHLTAQVASPGDAASRVRALARDGVDGIKVLVGGRDAPARISPETLRAIVREAHAAGLRVYVHPDDAPAAADAVAAGVDALVHPPGVNPPADLVEEIRAHGLTVATTLKAPGGQREAVVRAMAAAEVRMALGSDMPRRGPWEAVKREVDALSRAGLSNDEILVAATRGAAEHLGILDEVGTLEPGRVADLVLVRGDPREDLDALEQVEYVLQGGRLLPTAPPAPPHPPPAPPENRSSAAARSTPAGTRGG